MSSYVLYITFVNIVQN